LRSLLFAFAASNPWAAFCVVVQFVDMTISYELAKEKTRERYRLSYATNREHVLAKKKAWQAANPEKVRLSRKNTNWKIKLATLAHYGGKCVCCPESNPKFLSIDHINDDGYKTRAQNGRSGVASFYYWIKKNGYPTDLQVLCFNCNMAKAFWKICPHKESVTN
jgi:hypothetical protein